MNKAIVIFGAGNIGRSFIAQVFSHGGYDIIFVEVNAQVREALNRERRYRIIVKRNDSADTTQWIENVRCIDGRDSDAVVSALSNASVVATAVGKNNLGPIFPLLAAGLLKRRADHGDRPLDIIIAENARDMSSFFRGQMRPLFPSDFPFDRLVGLVETSIGKMVPIMKESDRESDPLCIFAEEYNELIVDEKGFRGPIPSVPDLCPRSPIAAFVDRKLFIHNLGHAATAYLGFMHHRECTFLYEVLAIDMVRQKVRSCMEEAAQALVCEYPETFTMSGLEEHIDDLLARFQNRSLGDTIYRVGRDIPRKIDKNDRLIGAMLLAKKHHLPCPSISEAVFSAALFAAHDDQGKLSGADSNFIRTIIIKSLPSILIETSRLSHADPHEAEVISDVLHAAMNNHNAIAL